MASPSIQPGIVASPAPASLSQVREAACDCQACPLWELGTQTVFGEGPEWARLMVVGEAPGQQEDRAGRPFVGAAGRLLTDLLAEAELDRASLYLTNVVKHRPSDPGVSGRRNRAPKQSEIRACQPWLEAEMQRVQPEVILCLGATSARVILGKSFRLIEQRGVWLPSVYAPRAMATLHPAYLLRQTGPEGADRLRALVTQDLRAVAQEVSKRHGAPATRDQTARSPR